MRWILGLVVVVVLAVLGYQFMAPQGARPVAERAVQPAAPAGQTGGQLVPAPGDQTAAAAPGAAEAPTMAGDQTLAGEQMMAGDRTLAGDQAPVSARTQALEDEVAMRARQVAADAARRMQATAERVARAAKDVARSGVDLEIGDLDLGKGIGRAVDELTATLDTVTDEASAHAAVPKLVAIDAHLYLLRPKVEKLPDDVREALASALTGMLPQVQTAIHRMETTPGASEIVKPALDPIMIKLDGWSQAPA